MSDEAYRKGYNDALKAMAAWHMKERDYVRRALAEQGRIMSFKVKFILEAKSGFHSDVLWLLYRVFDR